MLLYHPKANAPVDCHPTQVNTMKANGWTEEPPGNQKPKPKVKHKTETKPAT